MRPVTLSLFLFILFIPATTLSAEKVKKQESFLQKVENFFGLSSTKKTKDPKKIKESETTAISYTDKKDVVDSNYYRKISSKAIKTKQDNLINAMSNSCDPNESPFERLKTFKSNLIKLRKYLKAISTSPKVDLDQQMQSKDIYLQINEENVPFLNIIDEEGATIKDKVLALEKFFLSYQGYYIKDKESDLDDWAKTIVKGITCIDGQSL